MQNRVNRSYDTIVVGTGPGGASVARHLVAAGDRVLILEWGGDEPVTGGLVQMARELGWPGRSLLVAPGLLAMVRAITTGGSSIYFYGTAFEPPYEMLQRHGIDIRDDVAAIKAELPIGPLPADLIGPKATRLMQSAQSLGIDWNPLPKFIDHEAARKGGWLGFYEAPNYDAKWNARKWVDEAVSRGADLVTGARVERVLFAAGEAAGVEYRHDGRTVKAEAGRVVVAAGGIGSPLILRRSGIADAGRDFFFDPLIGVMGTAPGIDSGAEIPMATGIHCEDDGYVMTDMTVPRSLFMAQTASAGRIDRLHTYTSTLEIMIKAKDSLGGHLTDGGGVRKGLSRGDRDKLAHGYRQARRILQEAGADHIYRSSYMAAHPGGTVKAGELVDNDLQTENPGLYVCDCSVIPEAWGLPPTLTLLGLGRRLAGHLKAAGPAARTEVTTPG